MRKILGCTAVVLGIVGTLVSAASIGAGWWVAAKVDDRTTKAAARIDHGLSEADSSLAQTEERMSAIRNELVAVHTEAEKLAAENPELPRLQAAIERLLARFLPTMDRAAALANLLRTVAAGLRAAAEIRDLLPVKKDHPHYAENVAANIDRAAGVLNIPQAKIDAMKTNAAVQVVRELVEDARKAIAGMAWLTEALADARKEIAEARKWTAEWRDEVVFWGYVAAGVNTVVWVWVGLGQLCMIGWGRRRMTPPV